MRANEIRTGYAPQQIAKKQGRLGRRLIGQERGGRGAADAFEHSAVGGTEYTNYNRRGKYTQEGLRILPDRYYENASQAKVYYKGGSVTYVSLLETAVQTGAIVLDETKSMQANFDAAYDALISAKAQPLYPWSSTLYSEDGQYVFRVEGGQITGAHRAFYIDEDGRKITAQYLAEQLASGVLPADLDGDWSFLAHLDNELYTKACKMGEIKRMFDEKDLAFAKLQLPKEEYLEDIHLLLLYFLGRDDGLKGASLLRKLSSSGEFGKMALTGVLRGQAEKAAPPQRRPVTIEPLPVMRDTRTRRRISLA